MGKVRVYVLLASLSLGVLSCGSQAGPGDGVDRLSQGSASQGSVSNDEATFFRKHQLAFVPVSEATGAVLRRATLQGKAVFKHAPGSQPSVRTVTAGRLTGKLFERSYRDQNVVIVIASQPVSPRPWATWIVVMNALAKRELYHTVYVHNVIGHGTPKK